uniref:Uncharacterized protein n=1 Tax=Arundo donax TaxID=35708 RepID=A0A0A9FXF4_ARUDO
MILCSETLEDVHVGLSDDRRKVHRSIFPENTNFSCAHRIIRQASEYRRSIFTVSTWGFLGLKTLCPPDYPTIHRTMCRSIGHCNGWIGVVGKVRASDYLTMPKSKASDYLVRRIFDRLFPTVILRLGAYIYPIPRFIW